MPLYRSAGAGARSLVVCFSRRWLDSSVPSFEDALDQGDKFSESPLCAGAHAVRAGRGGGSGVTARSPLVAPATRGSVSRAVDTKRW